VTPGGEPGRRPTALLLVVGGALVVGVAALYATAERAAPPKKAADPPGGKKEDFWEKVARDLPDRPKWEAPDWEPKSAADRLVDRFVKLRDARDRAALRLLGRVPEVPDGPVSEAEAERLQTDFFLRDKDLRFRLVCRGEPDGNGGIRDTPGLYTLLGEGYVTAPAIGVKTDKGVDPPAQRMMSHPALVVEVRGGKIFGVRATLPPG
jgi:hypothetical protein